MVSQAEEVSRSADLSDIATHECTKYYLSMTYEIIHMHLILMLH